MIGEFARRCRLPVSTLRYYDRIGLLAPAEVDPVSGYRRYRVDQLATAARIAQLRAIGVAPEEIAGILDGGPRAAEILRRERARVADEIEAGRRRLSRIDELLADDAEEHYEVEFTHFPARRVVVGLFALPSTGLEAGITRAIAGLRSGVRRSGHRRVGPWGATFPLDLPETVTGFVFAPMAADDDLGELETRWLSGCPAATIEYAGRLETLPSAYTAAFAALDEAGVTPVEPLIEEYLGLDAPESSTRIRLWMPYDPESL
jgi:DNA-binding transcriptional MerR regulator